MSERCRFTSKLLQKARHLHVVEKLSWDEVAMRCGCKPGSLKSTLSEQKSGINKGLNDARIARTETMMRMYIEDGARICDIARRLHTTSPVIKRKLLSLGLDEEVREELTREVVVP